MTEPTYRLFFALWPDEQVRMELAAVSQMMNTALRGRPVPVNNLHMTLFFLGEVDAVTLQKIEHFSDHVCTSSFSITLSELVFRQKQQLVWVEAEEVPPQLADLLNVLRENLSILPVRLEKRQFVPHVTLVRKANSQRAPFKAITPIQWQVGHFSLVRSHLGEKGVRYEILKNWMLN